MILLSHHGWSAAPIAELLGCDPRTVRRWVQRYNSPGANCLGDLPRPGRPRLGSPRLGDRIRRLLAQPRAWTIGLLHRYLGRPAISLHTLQRRVREVAAWRRPRLVAKGDPDRDQVLAALRQQISDLPEGAVLLAEDETHINLLPWARATWVVRGTRQRVMTPGKNRRRTIFGAVDLQRPVSLSGLPQGDQRQLHRVLRAAAGRLSDGAGGGGDLRQRHHPHSKIVQAWLASHPLVRHGPRHSPHDNPVERIWGALKPYLANPPTPTMAGRIRQVHTFFQRSPAQLLVTAAPHSSPWLPDRYGQNFREAA
jgi:hypothetical protein